MNRDRVGPRCSADLFSRESLTRAIRIEQIKSLSDFLDLFFCQPWALNLLRCTGATSSASLRSLQDARKQPWVHICNLGVKQQYMFDENRPLNREKPR